MTKENFKRDIVRDALKEKVRDVFFELYKNWLEFDTESEATDFIIAIRELVKEYELSKSLLKKVCLFSSSAESKYYLCMETNKETVMSYSTFFGKNMELVATL